MNKCKRKKQTILESFIISLERKKKIASTILKNLLNMLLLYLIIIQYHIYVYTYIYIYIDTISLTSNIISVLIAQNV